MATKKKSNDFAKLNVCALGFGFGLATGILMVLIVLLNMWFGVGTPLITLIKSFYIGFAASYKGALMGFVWGTIDGFIFGIIAGFIYNKFACCHSCFICRCK